MSYHKLTLYFQMIPLEPLSNNSLSFQVAFLKVRVDDTSGLPLGPGQLGPSPLKKSVGPSSRIRSDKASVRSGL